MDILEKSNDPSLTNISHHGNQIPKQLLASATTSTITSTATSAAASNASGSSITEGSAGGGGGRDSLERVIEGVASTDFFKENAGLSSSGAGGLSPGSEDVSPGSASPLVLATHVEQPLPDFPVETTAADPVER